MKAYGGVNIYIHISLTSALLGGEWSATRLGRFTPEERGPVTRWIGGWVDPRAALDDVEKRKFLTLPGLEIRHLGRSAFCQSLYRLRYPSSLAHITGIYYTAHVIKCINAVRKSSLEQAVKFKQYSVRVVTVCDTSRVGVPPTHNFRASSLSVVFCFIYTDVIQEHSVSIIICIMFISCSACCKVISVNQHLLRVHIRISRTVIRSGITAFSCITPCPRQAAYNVQSRI
jgi:hypothetical protein